ncbi:Alpha-2-macroglobulin, partial [Ophiophagus hannah]
GICAVKIRIVCLHEDFRPANKKIPLIYVQDPKKNRLFQWNDVKLSMGLTQLSFPLSSEPALGTYKLVVEKSSRKVAEHTFYVEEYVLPKFEVLVTVPKQISVLATEFEMTVCGRQMGMGVEMTEVSSISITSTVSKLSFENAEPYYKPGIPLFLQMKLVDGMDVPMANKSIEITGPSGVYKENERCDNSVLIYHRRASHLVNRFYSPSQSYLHIEPLPKTLSCGNTEHIRVHFILDPNAVKKEMIFYYLVKPKGDFLLNLLVDVDTAPITRLLLYTILPSGELVAHSRDFTVEKCFSNKARLWFSDQQGLPGQKTQLHLAASSGS